MKKLKLVPVITVTLVATVLLGGVALATAGDRNDPLITLSYLEKTIMPQLLGDVEDEAEDIRKDMEDDFDDLIGDYTTKMEGDIKDALAKEETEQTTASAFAVVQMAQGETLALPIGAEIMLRIGGATIAGGSPAAINTTTATDLGNGGALVKNNLYLVTIDGRTLTATGEGTNYILLKNYEVAVPASTDAPA